MDSKKKQAGSSSSLDHLFGPMGSSSSSSSSSGLFNSIFPPPSTVKARKQDLASSKFQAHNEIISGSSKERSSMYQNEKAEPSYLSSSIYYGGQENYSPTSNTKDHPPAFKTNGGDDDPNVGNSDGASRGNWWQGSLYY